MVSLMLVGSCSPSGLQGRDSTGSLLSCVNGIWRKPGGRLSNIYINTAENIQNKFPGATAYCNGSYIAISGGASCTSNNGYI